ncbi:MAG: LysM peptidoglycan-binding domain-containing protein [Parabacteroides distasonis]|nr:LysM peptidoglycan-binding domain-containing protein [Parabacteroides distasonis]
MCHKLFISFIFLLFVQVLAGQSSIFGEQPYRVQAVDTLSEAIGMMPESLDADVDSLLRSWHVQYFSRVDAHCHDDEENVFFSDSVYAERLNRLPNIIQLSYNETVRDCIDLYADRKRNLVRYILGMADFYFPIIEKILDKHKLPLELKYLAVVESALNPVALSRVGACGLWQFMLPTGKIYGLEINSLLDERRDPEKATEAACRYFKDMYAIYGDWNLVLASYNCGPGNVNKAIRRSGGKTDFWEIFPYLPKETRSYVPLFIAANYIMNYYCDHNICPLQTSLPLATDTVMVNKMLHFQQVSELVGVEVEQLRALNPQYKRDIIPGNTKPSVLKLPASYSYSFVGKEDTVYKHRIEELLANCVAVNEADEKGRLTLEKITHVVASGENIYTIANKYGVTPKDIRKWNGLRSNRVAKGRRLRLHVDNGGVAFASSNTQKTDKKDATVASSSKDKHFYVVRSGDSLYSIAQKYPGVSPDALKKANGLTSSSIRPGQKLKIPIG